MPADGIEARAESPARVRQQWAVVLIGALGFLAVGVVDHDLWTPDEPRVAEIAREVSEGSLIPTLNGYPFLEKPPFYYWCVAATYRVVGQATPALARLPSALFAIGTAILIYAIGRRRLSGEAGVAAGLLTLYSVGWLDAGHRACVDSALAWTFAGSLWGLEAGLHGQSARERRSGWVLFYGFVSLGFWAKGLLGIAFPAGTLSLVLAFERRLAEILGLRHWLGAAFTAANVAAWLLILWEADETGGYLQEFVVHNHLERFLTSTGYVGGHENANPFYYFGNLLALFMPGALFLVNGLILVWKNSVHRDRLSVPFAGFLVGIVLLSLAGTKRSVYLLPLYGPLALLCAPWITQVLGDRRQGFSTRLVLWTAWGVISGATVAGPLVRGVYSGTPGHLVAAGVGVIVVWASFTALRPGGEHRVGWAAPLLLVAAYVLGFGSWVDVIDQKKSLRPFAEYVRSQANADSELLLYVPDETTEAFLCFYLHRMIPVCRDYEDLQLRLSQPKRTLVVIKQRRKETPPEWKVGNRLGLEHVTWGVRGTPSDANGPDVNILRVERTGRRRHTLLVAGGFPGRL